MENYEYFFMNEMFYGCNSLVSFPDLTRWNSEEVKVIDNIFYQFSYIYYFNTLIKY